MSGQWRTAGMAGVRVALDYTPLLLRMQRMTLSDEDFEDLYFCVRVLESVALEQMEANKP